jgi:hypothetical protein
VPGGIGAGGGSGVGFFVGAVEFKRHGRSDFGRAVAEIDVIELTLAAGVVNKRHRVCPECRRLRASCKRIVGNAARLNQPRIRTVPGTDSRGA